MKHYLFLIIVCLINFSCRTDSDINDLTGNNYISPLRNVLVTSPEAGETWRHGTSEIIRWNSSYTPNTIDIYVIKKKAYYETLVAKGIPNSGSHTWFIPHDIPLSNHYQIMISESGKEGAAGYSEVFFIK